MRTVLVIAALLSIVACANEAGRAAPPPPDAGGTWIGAAPTAAPDPLWWRALGDPLLGELVGVALQRNADLRAAAAQVREARANREAAFGPRLPDVELSAQAGRNELSENGELPINRIPGFSRRFNLFDAGFDASWEIDFWGRNASGVRASEARLAAATDALHGVQVQVVAEVVRNYVGLRSAQAQLASASADAAARSRYAALVAARRAAGEASRADEALAAQAALTTHSQLAALAADASAAAYALALLCGRPPEDLAALAAQPAPLPGALPAAGVGLRSELLLRRPDVRQAAQELAAATADVAVARADLFPRFTLLAAVGRQSLHSGNFPDPSSGRFQFGPASFVASIHGRQGARPGEGGGCARGCGRRALRSRPCSARWRTARPR